METRRRARPADEVCGKPVTILVSADHLDEEPGVLARIRAGERSL